MKLVGVILTHIFSSDHGPEEATGLVYHKPDHTLVEYNESTTVREGETFTFGIPLIMDDEDTT
jgi:hypothetical protein